ncbi:MAG: EAL domain-containing protein [Gammaproteobacteria bacterium]|nr:EAL domain-containing protein [Gammaproteobacteria bacterium]MDH4254221.1 EAL domain-containing protein [Gammaproteobacteria bacterium]MDH5310499.1 EAL domain-containing protein [Gammaproteobacteria bacterium]
MTENQRISIAVLSRKQDDVEIVNQSLRDAGHPVHCYWVKQNQLFDRVLAERRLELILLNCDDYQDTIRQVCKQRDGFQPEVPVLAVDAKTDEATMADAMSQGACDLVSLANRKRLQAVVTRELRAFRVERALNVTLQSATTYRKQLHDYMEGSNSAIAYVQEGIVTRVNRAWLQMFSIGSKDEIVGMPLMDAFEPESQAAVKGAIIATTRKKWQPDERLQAKSRLGGPDAKPVEVEFQLAEFEDGPHVQVRIAPPEKKAEEPTKLVHDALQRDPTTLFFHRAQFLERMVKRMAKKPASGLHLLAYIKPDSFSDVIDKTGIIASEDVLGLFAEEVRKRLHPRDLAGRFEGTALLALLERGSERDAEGWGKQLARHVAKHRFAAGQRELNLTCTVGICPVSDVFENLDELISAAKAAHRSGKDAGGNQAALNTAVDEDTKLKRHDQIWVKRIKAALIERRFRLAHLPIAGLRSDNGAMYDMLIRMLDEQGKTLLPSEFLPAAERNNLMKTLDRWMITASIEHCKTQHADRVFVRLSSHSLQDGTLADWIAEELKRNKVEPAKLCVQTAEQDAARYIKPARSLVSRLRKAGVDFALEHFGVDGRRLQILDILKPSYIKVDGELMHALTTDMDLQAKVASLVAKATELNIETIAERVENANTMAVLFQLGFHYMQGHYVHEPEVVLQEPVSVATTSLEAIAGR